MPKQKRDVSHDQIVLTGQFLRLAQRMGRTDLTTVPDQGAVKTALNQLKSAVKVAQNAYDLLIAAQAQEHSIPFTPPGVPNSHAGVSNGHSAEAPLPQRRGEHHRPVMPMQGFGRSSEF